MARDSLTTCQTSSRREQIGEFHNQPSKGETTSEYPEYLLALEHMG